MLEKYLKNKTIMSIAGIVIGVILMIWRGTVVEQMIRVVGYVLLAAAAVYLVMYYQGKKQNEVQLWYAAISGGAGLLLVLLSGVLLRFFPVMAGILLIINGSVSISQTYNNHEVPLYSKLLSVLLIALGILILIHPGAIANAIVFCIGAASAINGVCGLLDLRRMQQNG